MIERGKTLDTVRGECRVVAVEQCWLRPEKRDYHVRWEETGRRDIICEDDLDRLRRRTLVQD